MGIPIGEFSPSRGKAGASNDKTVRLSAVADMFVSGRVWAPDTRWARELIEEVAAFPAGEHDDYVDTMTQALMRIRASGLSATSMNPAPASFSIRAPASRRWAAIPRGGLISTVTTRRPNANARLSRVG